MHSNVRSFYIVTTLVIREIQKLRNFINKYSKAQRRQIDKPHTVESATNDHVHLGRSIHDGITPKFPSADHVDLEPSHSHYALSDIEMHISGPVR